MTDQAEAEAYANAGDVQGAERLFQAKAGLQQSFHRARCFVLLFDLKGKPKYMIEMD